LLHQTTGVWRCGRQEHLLAGRLRLQHHELTDARGSHRHRDPDHLLDRAAIRRLQRLPQPAGDRRSESEGADRAGGLRSRRGRVSLVPRFPEAAGSLESPHPWTCAAHVCMLKACPP
jgi:hypothetical protein